MSSPNEPAYPRTGEAPGSGNGSAAGSGSDGGSLGNAAARSGPSSAASTTGRITDRGDVPPWERGAARAPKPPQRPARETPARPDSARPGSSGHSPGVDARLNRFISGGTAPSVPAPSPPAPSEEADQSMTPTRNELVPNDAYASELPDLSGPVPRPPQRKPPTERTTTEPPNRPAAPTGRVQVGTHPRVPVRASMQIRRIDPWSALKVSLVLSVALFFVWMIAVAFLYLVLGGMGVWSKLNSNVGDLLTTASGSSGGELVSSGTIFGGAALIGLVNIVLLTAMATIGVFIYNLTTDLVGGVEVTLADRD